MNDIKSLKMCLFVYAACTRPAIRVLTQTGSKNVQLAEDDGFEHVNRSHEMRRYVRTRRWNVKSDGGKVAQWRCQNNAGSVQGCTD